MYGKIYCVRTGFFLRDASRDDWLRARSLADPSTGAYLDTDGRTIRCDGPAVDPLTEPEIILDVDMGDEDTFASTIAAAGVLDDDAAGPMRARLARRLYGGDVDGEPDAPQTRTRAASRAWPDRARLPGEKD